MAGKTPFGSLVLARKDGFRERIGSRSERGCTMRFRPLKTLGRAAAAGCLTAALLAGCAQSAPELGEPVDALGSSYEQALAAVSERVDDPTLLAVRCSDTETGQQPVWSYLFGSQSMSFMYNVAPNAETGEYSASTYGRLEWNDKSWEEIPSPDAIAVSSTDALSAVEAACRESNPMKSYSANLVTFLSGDGSTDASVSPLKWEVVVNADEEEELTGECYTVDAVTGELSQKVVSTDEGAEVSDTTTDGEGIEEPEPDLGPKGTGYKSSF